MFAERCLGVTLFTHVRGFIKKRVWRAPKRVFFINPVPVYYLNYPVPIEVASLALL